MNSSVTGSKIRSNARPVRTKVVSNEHLLTVCFFRTSTIRLQFEHVNPVSHRFLYGVLSCPSRALCGGGTPVSHVLERVVLGEYDHS